MRTENSLRLWAKLGTRINQRSNDFYREGKHCLISSLSLETNGRRVTPKLTRPSCQDQTRAVTSPPLRVKMTFPLPLRLRPCKAGSAAEGRICSAKQGGDVYRLIGPRGVTVDPVPSRTAVEIQRSATERSDKWEEMEKVRICFLLQFLGIKRHRYSPSQVTVNKHFFAMCSLS